jgi:hypothetical protein
MSALDEHRANVMFRVLKNSYELYVHCKLKCILLLVNPLKAKLDSGERNSVILLERSQALPARPD